MLLPIPLLLNLLLGLLALAFFVCALLLLRRAWKNYQHIVHRPQYHVRIEKENGGRVGTGVVHETTDPARSREAIGDRAVWVPLLFGLTLLSVTFVGREIVSLAFPSGRDEPREVASSTVQYLTTPDGAKVRTEVFGLQDGPTLVFTHGWGTSSAEWYYAKEHLSGRFRLILWDLPGLGDSSQPRDKDYALENMARDLDAVLGLANGKPVILVGHSIGGMINLTFCRLFPDKLGHQVLGIAEFDTSYTNPVTTTKDASLSRALQKPVAEPLLHAMIWFSPVFRIMNWLSYRSGLSQINNAESSFAGSETWGQVDFISSYQYKSSPAVVARGTLAMFHWDAKPVLSRIPVPVLIMVGQQDTTTLPSASEYMKGTLLNSSLEIVNPSAHYGLLEQNETYDASVAKFALACLKSKNP